MRIREPFLQAPVEVLSNFNEVQVLTGVRVGLGFDLKLVACNYA